MNATEWTALTVAAIGAVGAIVLQGLQMYLSYKRDLSIKEGAAKVVEKLDANTEITKAGTEAATTNAEAAVVAATTAATRAEEIADQMNGKLEQKITLIVKAQVEPILRSVADIKTTLNQLRDQAKK